MKRFSAPLVEFHLRLGMTFGSYNNVFLDPILGTWEVVRSIISGEAL
jgi:hypothetical protein